MAHIQVKSGCSPLSVRREVGSIKGDIGGEDTGCELLLRLACRGLRSHLAVHEYPCVHWLLEALFGILNGAQGLNLDGLATVCEKKSGSSGKVRNVEREALLDGRNCGLNSDD